LVQELLEVHTGKANLNEVQQAEKAKMQELFKKIDEQNAIVQASNDVIKSNH